MSSARGKTSVRRGQCEKTPEAFAGRKQGVGRDTDYDLLANQVGLPVRRGLWVLPSRSQLTVFFATYVDRGRSERTQGHSVVPGDGQYAARDFTGSS